MREIGVRELKARLSEVLRLVEQGDQVRVTTRGRPVADIVPAVPARARNEVRELVAAGRVTAPSRSRGARPRLAKSKRSASAILLADRDVERR